METDAWVGLYLPPSAVIDPMTSEAVKQTYWLNNGFRPSNSKAKEVQHFIKEMSIVVGVAGH